MICPDSDCDCDNPGCRHGGCQGRRPDPPLLRILALSALGEQPDRAPPRASARSSLSQARSAP